MLYKILIVAADLFIVIVLAAATWLRLYTAPGRLVAVPANGYSLLG